MPEQLTKYPEITLRVLRTSGAVCAEGVEQRVLTECPAEQFCKRDASPARFSSKRLQLLTFEINHCPRLHLPPPRIDVANIIMPMPILPWRWS